IKPHVLISSPQTLALLLEICPYGFHELEGVLSSADYLDPQLAQKIQTKWHCQLLNHYGLTEVCFGCAVECPAHHGMHLRALDLRLEIIDPQSKQPVPMGQVGEIVITTLRHTAMPLIRYRTGDIASLLPGPCACGSPLPRLGEVLGRLEPASGQIVHQAKGGASCLPL
ncbi:MAG: phenylacetate--CoA ligase family protein, partial [Desulfovibrio sp.]|nr:phenylacetate--CoA ligase family protein [Desulfovibrio sp.]